MENIKKKLTAKRLIIIFILVTLVICVISYLFGKSSSFDNAVINEYAQIKLKTDNDYQSRLIELDSIKKELESQKELLDEMNQYKNDKENKTSEIANLDTEISAKTFDLSSINAEISAKSNELEKLKTGIVLAKQEPKKLPAGEFTVGKDISAGRYSVSGKRNFIVHSSDGRLKVNTILGSGPYSNECYVCNLQDGDTIQASSACTLTPIE